MGLTLLPINALRLGMVAAAILGGLALASAKSPEKIAFAGGHFRIVAVAGGEYELRFNDQLLAQNQVVKFQRATWVGGQKVALFSIGDKSCGFGVLVAFKTQGSMESDYACQPCMVNCVSVQPVVSDERILFVPDLKDGASAPLQTWSPRDRLGTLGVLSNSP